ncbi:hypothetical protein GFY24_09355 [Nocardia sp. SYP-A9097]|uniref:hypothetical protein n=1 Tax=Nocardia sp. SYP-A9097 TaxID=2663237 RepID=UPI00129B8C2D|nr:hypothetical protein [Nocardia sp. SYP-A9097]MRH87655.1 hypothetical protein [Nocardia sp. SYP-A9097]
MEALFVLFIIAFAAVLILGLFLSAGARKQIDTYAKVPYEHVTDVVHDHFGSVWWRAVDGPGDMNFRARGFGLSSIGSAKPVLSVKVTALDNGNVSVAAWMSSWSQRMGIVGCCDRVYFKRRTLIQKIEAL